MTQQENDKDFVINVLNLIEIAEGEGVSWSSDVIDDLVERFPEQSAVIGMYRKG